MLARCIPTLALDPVLVEIPFPFFGLEGLPIRWYALAYIAGLFFGLWYVNQLVRRPRLSVRVRPVRHPRLPDDRRQAGVRGAPAGAHARRGPARRRRCHRRRRQQQRMLNGKLYS